MLRVVRLLVSAIPAMHLLPEEGNCKLFSLSVGPESVLCCGWLGWMGMSPVASWRLRGCSSEAGDLQCLGRQAMERSPKRSRDLFLHTGFHAGRQAKGV